MVSQISQNIRIKLNRESYNVGPWRRFAQSECLWLSTVIDGINSHDMHYKFLRHVATNRLRKLVKHVRSWLAINEVVQIERC